MYVCPLLEGGLIEFTGTQIRVTPDPEIRGEAAASQKIFGPFGPQFGVNIRGEDTPPGPLPWICHWFNTLSSVSRGDWNPESGIQGVVSRFPRLSWNPLHGSENSFV